METKLPSDLTCYKQCYSMSSLRHKTESAQHPLSKLRVMYVVQDAVRALKARLSDATAALQISHSEGLRLRTRVADLKAAVSWVRLVSIMQ